MGASAATRLRVAAGHFRIACSAVRNSQLGPHPAAATFPRFAEEGFACAALRQPSSCDAMTRLRQRSFTDAHPNDYRTAIATQEPPAQSAWPHSQTFSMRGGPLVAA
jgi:hypothetical protein